MSLTILCRYEREGKVSGHWCNLCPPPYEYATILKEEILAFKAKNTNHKKKSDKRRGWKK